MKKEYITLTQNERMILQSYIPVVQGLGQYLGEGPSLGVSTIIF